MLRGYNRSFKKIILFVSILIVFAQLFANVCDCAKSRTTTATWNSYFSHVDWSWTGIPYAWCKWTNSYKLVMHFTKSKTDTYCCVTGAWEEGTWSFPTYTTDRFDETHDCSNWTHSFQRPWPSFGQNNEPLFDSVWTITVTPSGSC
jgi:hypothetical protein